MIETIKASEDGKGIIIRMYEFENAKTHATISFGMGKKIKEVYECNLMEEPEDVLTEYTDKEFSFLIKPFEIKTYKVILMDFHT